MAGLNAGGERRAPGDRPAPKTPPKTLFFQKRRKQAHHACFRTFKSKSCPKVAEKVRNVFRTTSRTCGVSIEPKLAELHPKNRLNRPQKGLFLAPFQHK